MAKVLIKCKLEVHISLENHYREVAAFVCCCDRRLTTPTREMDKNKAHEEDVHQCVLPFKEQGCVCKFPKTSESATSMQRRMLWGDGIRALMA